MISRQDLERLASLKSDHGILTALEFSVPNLVDIDTTTKTGTLAQSMDEVPRFIVAVLQRDKTRIYIVERGISEQQSQVETETWSTQARRALSDAISATHRATVPGHFLVHRSSADGYCLAFLS